MSMFLFMGIRSITCFLSWESDMKKLDRACSKRTICEVHRQMYDIIITKVENKDVQADLKALTLEAFEMGIKLVQRLIDRKIKMIEWNQCEDKETLNELRQERIRLEKEKAWMTV